MERKGVGRPRDGNPEETRREILRAAAESFAAAGFVGATTRAVAARAGVNVATLHYHFGSKEGLYRAVLRDASREPLPAVPSGTGAETVGRLVEALFDYGMERPTLSRLALLDALAGPLAEGGENADRRIGWLAERLRPLLPPENGRPAQVAEEPARAIVALVDATFVAAGRRASGDADPGTLAEAVAAPASVPDETARRAVVAAARRLTGLD